MKTLSKETLNKIKDDKRHSKAEYLKIFKDGKAYEFGKDEDFFPLAERTLLPNLPDNFICYNYKDDPDLIEKEIEILDENRNNAKIKIEIEVKYRKGGGFGIGLYKMNDYYL